MFPFTVRINDNTYQCKKVNSEQFEHAEKLISSNTVSNKPTLPKLWSTEVDCSFRLKGFNCRDITITSTYEFPIVHRTSILYEHRENIFIHRIIISPHCLVENLIRWHPKGHIYFPMLERSYSYEMRNRFLIYLPKKHTEN